MTSSSTSEAQSRLHSSRNVRSSSSPTRQQVRVAIPRVHMTSHVRPHLPPVTQLSPPPPYSTLPPPYEGVPAPPNISSRPTNDLASSSHVAVIRTRDVTQVNENTTQTQWSFPAATAFHELEIGWRHRLVWSTDRTVITCIYRFISGLRDSRYFRALLWISGS